MTFTRCCGQDTGVTHTHTHLALSAHHVLKENVSEILQKEGKTRISEGREGGREGGRERRVVYFKLWSVWFRVQHHLLGGCVRRVGVGGGGGGGGGGWLLGSFYSFLRKNTTPEAQEQLYHRITYPK